MRLNNMIVKGEDLANKWIRLEGGNSVIKSFHLCMVTL